MGLGSYVPDRVVTNDEIPFLNEQHERCAEQQTETNDEWIQERTGIEARRYVPKDGSVPAAISPSRRRGARLPTRGSRRTTSTASSSARCRPTSTSRAPRCSCRRSSASRTRRAAPASTSASSAPAFVYGLQMADAFVRTGMYKRILLVGAELHSHSLDYSTRGRDVMVLFGDGAGAMVIGPSRPTTRARALCTRLGARWHRRAGPLPQDLRDREGAVPRLRRQRPRAEPDMYPQMDGKRVFLNAVRGMVMSTQHALARPASAGTTSTGSCRTRRTCASTRRSSRSRRSRPRRCSTRSSSTATRRPRRCRSRSTTGAAGQGEEGRPRPLDRVRLRLHLGHCGVPDLAAAPIDCPSKASLNMLRFHQILRPNESFHTFPLFSPINLIPCY